MTDQQKAADVPKVFVVFWKYSDGSGCGIVRAYTEKETAERDLNMLRLHSNTNFEIEEADLY